MLEWIAAVALAPLYNRVGAEGSFENGTRQRVFDEVRLRPGRTIAEVAGAVGVSHSTASYHLDRLAGFDLLASIQDGNKLRFFVSGGTFAEEDLRVLAALSNAQTRRVLAAILAEPGCYRAELSTTLRVSSPTVNWHLRRLFGAGLVGETRQGRSRCLFADRERLRGVFAALEEKVRGTQFDGSGLRDLRMACGA